MEEFLRSVKNIKSDIGDLVFKVNNLIGLLASRGYGDRDRLLRKMLEEIGEYAEAVEFKNGATRKLAKFSGQDPHYKLKEEISDVIMVALALARVDGLKIEDIFEVIKEKLSKREDEFVRSKRQLNLFDEE